VCDDAFGSTDAAIACQQLGFSSGSVLGTGSTPNGSGQIWLDEVGCGGSESRLDECPASFWGYTTGCFHSTDIGVSCTP
jgi:hypothetical protein